MARPFAGIQTTNRGSQHTLEIVDAHCSAFGASLRGARPQQLVGACSNLWANALTQLQMDPRFSHKKTVSIFEPPGTRLVIAKNPMWQKSEARNLDRIGGNSLRYSPTPLHIDTRTISALTRRQAGRTSRSTPHLGTEAVVVI